MESCVRVIMGILPPDEARASRWDNCRLRSELMCSPSFWQDEYYFGKMRRKLPQISSSQLRPPYVPKKIHLLSNLPKLDPNSPGSPPMWHSPLCIFCPTTLPPLDGGNSFHYPIHVIYLPSSYVPSRLPSFHSVRSDLLTYSSIFALSPPK